MEAAPSTHPASAIPALPQPAAPLSAPGEFRYMARQPILDASKELYGYELLFRADAGETVSTVSREEATHSTFDLSLLLGADSFTEGYPAFINCTRQALCSGVAYTLPRELAVIEVLEDVPADAEVLAACRALKEAGYMLALDDVVGGDDRPALLALADIVKVDFLMTSATQQRNLARQLVHTGLRLLAEKVESHEQFHTARAMGYTLFQGYFFCRPQIMQARDLPSTHLGYLEILRRAYEPELDIPALAQAIREEPALMYRLLRYLNSAAFGVGAVNSIVQALNLLGARDTQVGLHGHGHQPGWPALTRAYPPGAKPSPLLRAGSAAHGRAPHGVLSHRVVFSTGGDPRPADDANRGACTPLGGLPRGFGWG